MRRQWRGVAEGWGSSELGCWWGLCGRKRAGGGKGPTETRKKGGKIGRRVGGLKLQPAFNFSQTTWSWCPIPYIFKGMYTSPLSASDTDGDRNIQAQVNQRLWCYLPCGALCWQTKLAINIQNWRWTSSLVLSKLCHQAAGDKDATCYTWFNWDTVLRKQGRVVLVETVLVELELFLSCSSRKVIAPFHPHGKAELFMNMTLIMEPLHPQHSSFHRRVRDGWYTGTIPGLFSGPESKVLVFNGEKETDLLALCNMLIYSNNNFKDFSVSF